VRGGRRCGFWIWFAASFSSIRCAGYWRAGRTGNTERIPARGGVLLVMNHISHIDPLYDAVFVPSCAAPRTSWRRSRCFRPPLVAPG